MGVTYLSSFDDEVMLAVFHLMLVFIISKEERVGQVLFLTRVEWRHTLSRGLSE